MNAPILTPLALANAEVLRALRDQDFNTVADLARLVDRDADNLRKSLKALEKAGLLQLDGGPKHPRPVLIDLGHQALDALDRAEASPPPASTIFAWQIQADPHNPRKDFDSEEAKAALAELSASIVRDGLIENLVLRPVADMTVPHPLTDQPCPAYMLIAGERRFRAILEAMTDGHLPEDWPIPHTVREVDEVTARRLALVENLQRRDLKPLEEARALQQLVELDGRSTADIAQDIGFTQRWAQQRLQLLQLSPAMQALLDDGRLKIEGARTVLAIWDRLPPIKQTELEAGRIEPAAAKAWLDQQPEPLSDAAKLAIMELYEKLAAEPLTSYYFGGGKATIVAGTVEWIDRGENGVSITCRVEDAKGVFAELRKRNLIDNPSPVRVEGVETGQVLVNTGYNGDYCLRQLFPSALDAKFRAKNIPTLRVMVYGLKADYDAGQSGGYATPWLTPPPFTPSAEIAAEIEAKRNARLERERESKASADRQVQARLEAERRRLDRLKASAALEPELREALSVNLGAFTGLLTGKSDELGWKLPLYLDETGGIIDAGGREVTAGLYHYEREERLPFLRFLVAAVNVAAGLETPAARPVEMDPDAMPRADFEAAVIGCLVASGGAADDDEDAPEPLTYTEAARIAPLALDALLAEEGWAYGEADTHDWDENGAQSLAEAIRRGEYDNVQLDLEDAIEAGGEDVG
ncbi:ParB/RepB/Spo0J family partition protein [Phenylobacterium sp.]|uniref:ParB/RepB/Spo0J family partition protein n=1 Tax=Phenylobacterium sp. TaxID=1871053 RepID=UPI0035B3976A